MTTQFDPAPFRKVKGLRNYVHKSCPHNSRGTNVLTLECGHTTSRKGSITIPIRARCMDCQLEQQQAQERLSQS